jgi:hypothetical protein
MTPPERYSISPLPSFCTVIAAPRRPPSLIAQLRDLLRWLGIVRPPHRNLTQRIADERMVAALAAELDAEGVEQPDVR